jgi:uncharacterized Zn finger protein
MVKKKKSIVNHEDPTYESDYDPMVEYQYVTDESEYATAGDWPPYRSVAERKKEAEKLICEMIEGGQKIQPVTSNGRKISKTFWGQSWCRNLEAQHDYESRLPRGRSYLKNSSVVDLQITDGMVSAQVLGSILYNVEITLLPLETEKWLSITKRCAGNIGSVLELLSGKLSHEVMEVLTDEDEGMFPSTDEIVLNCNCPDYADMCKHVAAVLYGIGARLDTRPELFFTLRGVDRCDLVAESTTEFAVQIDTENVEFDKEELETLFGIDICL